VKRAHTVGVVPLRVGVGLSHGTLRCGSVPLNYSWKIGINDPVVHLAPHEVIGGVGMPIWVWCSGGSGTFTLETAEDAVETQEVDLTPLYQIGGVR